jgi:hypothetical protein
MDEERGSRRRRAAATVLVVLASLLAFGAIAAIWIDRQVLDTDNWTSASSELLEQPVVRDRLASYLTDQIYENVDVEGELRSALPGRAEALAGPIAGALRDVVERRARQALEREDVQELWEKANRSAHRQLLRVINDDESLLATEGDDVVLNLRPLLENAEGRAGIAQRASAALAAGAGQLVVMRADQLKTGQRIGRLLQSLPIVLVVASLVLFGIALAVAPAWRRRAVRAYGIGLVLAGAAALALEAVGGNAVVGSLARTASMEPVVRAVWDIYTPLLEQAAWATIGYGVVVVVGAWLAGPTRWAVALRRALAPYMREPVLVYLVVALLVIVVLFWWQPTPATRNPVTAFVLVALLLLGVEGLRRRTLREFPDADRAAAAERRRERIGALTGRAAAGARAGSAAVARHAGHRGGSAAVAEDARLESLERLAELRAAGVLDDAEVRAEKARILGAPDGLKS